MFRTVLTLLVLLLAGCTAPAAVEDQPLELVVVSSGAPDWVQVRVTNGGHGALTIYPGEFRLIDAMWKVKTYDPNAQAGFPAEKRLQITELQPGASVEGYVGFAIGSGTAPYTLTYDAFHGVGQVVVG